MSIATPPKPAAIDHLAREIQQQADTAKHLAQAVSQAMCDLDPCPACQLHRKDEGERILLFSGLIEEVAKKIGVLALQVEEAESELRQSAKAA